jgi:Tol biopolymer transport system component
MPRAGGPLLRFAAPSLLLVLGCQRSAPSPPEPLRPSPADAAVIAPCLAETHPILTHTSAPPRSQLAALGPTGEDSLPLGSGAFVYGSVWAPDGRSIAFRRRVISLSERFVPSELGLLAPDVAGEEVVLTVEAAPTVGVATGHADEPSWSPDGRRIAFASQRDSDHYRIWVMARSGGQATLLLPELDAVPHFYASWSPRDAERFAYVAEAPTSPDLWVTDLGSGEHRNLTAGAMEDITSPAWSPDGERIAFSALLRERPLEQRDARDIFVVDLASNELRAVTTNDRENIEPAWSPDGSTLIISSSRGVTPEGPGQTMNLWLLTLDGSRAPEQLTNSRSTIAGTDWYRFATCGDSGR